MRQQRRRILVTFAILVALGVPAFWGLGVQRSTAQSGARRGFTVESLSGSYASSGRADGFLSRSVGVVTFDGRGGLTRFVRINSSDGMGGRRLLEITSIGTYSVDADGMGVMDVTNMLPSGETANVTFDFVVSKSRRGGANGAIQALEITTIQQQPGLTASLVEDYLTFREGL